MVGVGTRGVAVDTAVGGIWVGVGVRVGTKVGVAVGKLVGVRVKVNEAVGVGVFRVVAVGTVRVRRAPQVGVLVGLPAGLVGVPVTGVAVLVGLV